MNEPTGRLDPDLERRIRHALAEPPVSQEEITA